MESWAKWREADAEADEAEEYHWLLAGAFEQCVESGLNVSGGPIVETAELAPGFTEEIADFMLRKDLTCLYQHGR